MVVVVVVVVAVVVAGAAAAAAVITIYYNYHDANNDDNDDDDDEKCVGFVWQISAILCIPASGGAGSSDDRLILSGRSTSCLCPAEISRQAGELGWEQKADGNFEGRPVCIVDIVAAKNKNGRFVFV